MLTNKFQGEQAVQLALRSLDDEKQALLCILQGALNKPEDVA